MKRLLFIIGVLLFSTFSLFAQAESGEGSFTIDLGTFTGIMAVVSMIVTQILKVVPAISKKGIYKILTSVGIGLIVCIVGWLLKIAPPLHDFAIWQILIYGIAVGLSGCGFYDIVKAIGGLFKKE